MLTFLKIVFLFGISELFEVINAHGVFPHHSNITHLFPMDKKHFINCIGGEHLTVEGQAWIDSIMVDTRPGPFGVRGTSLTGTNRDWHVIFFYGNYKPTPSFTVLFSLFAHHPNKYTSAIVRFGWSENRFEVNHRSLPTPMLEIKAMNKLIDHYPVLVANSWNFIAVTFDNKTQFLSILHGTDPKSMKAIVQKQPAVSESTEFFNGLVVGESYSREAFVSNDSLSCLALYTIALTAGEVTDVFEECERIQEGSEPKQPPTTTTPAVTLPSPPDDIAWPHSSNLLAVWPLDDKFRHLDVGGKSIHGTAIPTSTLKAVAGPFGDAATALETSVGGPVLAVRDVRLSITASFTVAFFIKPTGNDGGIFEFVDSDYRTDKAFQARYFNQSWLQLGANGLEIVSHQLVRRNAWNFFAIAFKWDQSMLTIYGPRGLIVRQTAQPDVAAAIAFSNGGFHVGFAEKWKQFLSPGDAVSCVSVYTTALSDDSIRQLHDSCRLVIGSRPCGSPKVLGLPPTPSVSKMTKIPEHGQFPFIGAVRWKNSTVCSASIIDAFWLLTAATCFSEMTFPAEYSVNVGDFDSTLDEPSERLHSIHQVLVHHQKELALIELTEPIDFTNQYVNDICLPQSFDVNSEQWFFGWGVNGRLGEVKSSVPRYVSGRMLTEDQCLAKWNETDNYKIERHVCFTSMTSDLNVPCSHDEGGPLMAVTAGNDEKSRLVSLGVYLERDGECSASKPGRFARIGAYESWISLTINCAVPGVSYPTNCPL